MPNSSLKVTKHHHCCLHRTLRWKQKDLDVPSSPGHPMLDLSEAPQKQDWDL